ncbi:hypothetical protein QTV49_001742 [Vibrio vulnificus]|nr:hypothetical protein [Vibrio vulnificus]
MNFEDHLRKEIEEYKESLIQETSSLIMANPNRHPHLTYESVSITLTSLELDELEETHKEYSEKLKSLTATKTEPPAQNPLNSLKAVKSDFTSWVTKFHGSDEDIGTVDFSKSIHFGFHVGTLEQAKMFGDKIHRVEFGYNNLLRMDDLGTWSPASILNDLKHKQIITTETATNILNEQDDEKKDKMIREAIVNAGFDAIVYRNEVEKKGSLSYIILTSEQINSISLNKKSSHKMKLK